ncbi:MAG: hypothetical protein V4510_04540 [bacterium]
MGLASVQQAVATLLMEDTVREAWVVNRSAFARKWRLAGRDARLVAGLDARDLTYFAAHRRIDRMAMLAAEMPRSARTLGERGLGSYFQRHPYALEATAAETARFAAWAARHAKPAVADLVRFEMAQARLRRARPRAAAASVHPTRAPGVVLLRLAHRVDGTRLRPASPTFYGLRRLSDEVAWFRYGALEETLLRTANGRTGEAAWLRRAASECDMAISAARAAARELRTVALLCPTTHKRQGPAR